MHGGNQTIVDSETIDAIRALTRAVGDAGESLARTSASVVLGGPYLTLLTRACGALQLKMNPASPAHDQGHEHHRHPPAARPQPTSAASHARPPGGTRYGEEHTGHDKHAGHSVAMFRDKFWISLLLTIPTLVWGHMIQTWLGYTAPDVPRLRAGSPPCSARRCSSTAAGCSCRAACGELRDRLPGMMTLISLAITRRVRVQRRRDARLPGRCRSGGSWRRSSRSCCSATGSRCARSRRRRARCRSWRSCCPSTAQRIVGERDRGGADRRTLRDGDLVLVRPGASVPADGVVRERQERRQRVDDHRRVRARSRRPRARRSSPAR